MMNNVSLDLNNLELKFALQAVRQAALLVRQVQAELVTPALMKKDRSPVTVADYASQALVGHLIDQVFPNDPLVGEEDSSALQAPEARQTLERVSQFVACFTSQASPERVSAWIDRGGGSPRRRFWTLDPIDGTKGFLRGDQYAVALALIVDGQVQVSALGCPNLTAGVQPEIGGPGLLVFAARDAGTWVEALEDGDSSPTRLYVSALNNPLNARLLRSVESAHTNVSKIDHVAGALGVQTEPVRMDSQAKYALLAAGQADIYLRLLSPDRPGYREKIWDQAAGSLLVEEAGGVVTDLDGKPLDFTAGRMLVNNRGICASNNLLHPLIIQALHASGA